MCMIGCWNWSGLIENSPIFGAGGELPQCGLEPCCGCGTWYSVIVYVVCNNIGMVCRLEGIVCYVVRYAFWHGT